MDRIQMSIIPSQRIVLADGSRLLHEMLRRILDKADNMEVIEEVHDLADLPPSIRDLEADWVIMSLPFDADTPEWVDEYLADHPYVGLLVLSSDSSRIRMKWTERHEQELDDPSLGDLIQILGSHPRQTPET
jgi:AmiR/NasT family two-component response regulator